MQTHSLIHPLHQQNVREHSISLFAQTSSRNIDSLIMQEGEVSPTDESKRYTAYDESSCWTRWNSPHERECEFLLCDQME